MSHMPAQPAPRPGAGTPGRHVSPWATATATAAATAAAAAAASTCAFSVQRRRGDQAQRDACSHDHIARMALQCAASYPPCAAGGGAPGPAGPAPGPPGPGCCP